MIDIELTKEDLEGRKLEVKGNSGGHNYGKKGSIIYVDEYTIVQNAPTGGKELLKAIKSDGNRGNHINFRDISIVEETIDDFNKQLAQLDSKINKIKEQKKAIIDKIDFMVDHKLNKFDKNEYKVFKIIKEVRQSKSDMELAKSIAKIVG